MRISRLVQLSAVIGATCLLLSGCNNSSSSGNSMTNGLGGGSGSSSTVAYVYVTNQTTSSGPNQIVAYSAAANGQLTAIAGSPFSDNVGSLAASGSYLEGAAISGPDINSYTIGSNGALTSASQFNYGQQTGTTPPNNCGSVGDLIFDQTGQSLYGESGNIQCSNNNAIVSFAVDPSKGTVSYLGNVNIGYEASGLISILGNNDYAYSALNDSCMYGGVSSFARENSGLLNFTTNSTITPEFGPPAPAGATSSGVKLPSYAAGMTAADNSNHVAMAEYPCFAQNGVAATQVQLATYTADANGNLTTTDTSATMPATAISTPQSMKISPSGSYLAIGGIGGLQVFNFNGASPITTLTKVLTTDSITQVMWDKSNHLYAITLTGTAYGSNSVSPGKLHVYTVTSSGATEAPGSPYTITQPVSIAIANE